MTSQTVVIVAGVPPEIDRTFSSSLRAKLSSSERTEVLCPPLELSRPYTDCYSKKLYDRLVKKLRSFRDWHERRATVNTRLLVLYLYKEDMNDSCSCLFRRFGMEALIVPLKIQDMGPLDTGGQKSSAISKLAEEARKAIVRAKKLLKEISEEITNRDSKNCLLLPRKSFGKDISEVFEYVRNTASKNATLNEAQLNKFRNKLRNFEKELLKTDERGRKYFRGEKNIEFRSVTKSGPRHGQSPVWDDSAHNASCVIRGHLRFGASYAPDFHYDCDMGNHSRLIFSNCHDDQVTVKRKDRYVNISPNDNIRF